MSMWKHTALLARRASISATECSGSHPPLTVLEPGCCSRWALCLPVAAEETCLLLSLMLPLLKVILLLLMLQRWLMVQQWTLILLLRGVGMVVWVQVWEECYLTFLSCLQAT